MKIQSITKTNDRRNLIDIGVEGDHTYYVSISPQSKYVLTHNSYPDIDSDVADRDEAFEYIKEWFGEHNVIAVSNFNGLKLRSLIKDLGKIYNIPFQEINEYTSKIEFEAKSEAKKKPGFDAQTWVLTYEEAMDKSPAFKELLDKYPILNDSIHILFKQLRNCSRHAGGVLVLDDGPSQLPIIRNGGVFQTPWTEGLGFRHLEDFGFLKFDVLSVGTLRKVEACIKRILKNRYAIKIPTFNQIKSWFYENLHPDNNKMNDAHVYKHVFWEKRFAGIFQFINPQVQDLISKVKPTCINDLSTVTALYRPGPMGLKAHIHYVGNRQNPKQITYHHPLQKEVLESTSGVLTYQEQVQLMYNKLAGVPLDETDGIRKAFNKKDQSKMEEKEEAINKLKQEFIEKCFEANGINDKTASAIFDDMKNLVSYSFNKSVLVTEMITTYDDINGSNPQQKPIGLVKSGEFVKSRNEETKETIFVEVLQNHDHGILDVFEIELENGKTISCTLDHKFRVLDGRMLPLKQILVDELEIVDE